MTALTSTPNNLRTALMAGSIALAMVGLGFASVPLYRIFCQVTGFGGTTMRISEAEAATVQAVNKTIVVR
ncbi:MAG: cytochrome c oxidase assembly protein, partial [Sphingorhabdus sp.]